MTISWQGLVAAASSIPPAARPWTGMGQGCSPAARPCSCRKVGVAKGEGITASRLGKSRWAHGAGQVTEPGSAQCPWAQGLCHMGASHMLIMCQSVLPPPVQILTETGLFLFTLSRAMYL